MLKEMPNCSARKYRFSMVMGKDLHKRMRIPQSFIEQMPEELSGITILQGPSGNGWPVNTMKYTNDTYLEDGWEAFMTDHSLTEGEILIFTYVTPVHFKVKIFGRNACEREDAFTVQASLKSRRGDEAKFTAKDAFTSSHGPTSFKERKKCRQSPPRDAGYNYMSSISKESKLKALRANEVAHRFANSLVRPNFVTQIKHYFLHTQRYLAVPAFFVRKHLPKTKTMKLRCPNGKESRVKFFNGLPRCPSRIYGGWIPFAYANNIKEGDSCVFELVHEDLLQMHIFRY